jgi:hypothetical protein
MRWKKKAFGVEQSSHYFEEEAGEKLGIFGMQLRK